LVEFAGRGHIEPNIEAALAYAREHADADDVILITGSLFLVGEARRLFVK
jgi:folylpolyglutamate synthase/dihydropteroate synthase